MPSIEVDQNDIDKVENMLWYIKNGAKKALVKAVNKTAKSTKTQWAKEIKKDLDLKAARIKQDIYIDKANFSKISGTTYVKDNSVTLNSFSTTWWNQSAGGVYSKPWKNQNSWFIFGAFIANLKGTNQVVMRERREKSGKTSSVKRSAGAYVNMARKYRYPIVVKYGPSPYAAAGYQPLIGPLTTKMSAFLLTKMESETQDLIRRAAL